MDNYVQILGTRGSVPVSGQKYFKYGGATTSVLVKLAGRYLVLDAGSGICSLPEEALAINSLDIFLTHLHLDHLIGLPYCPFLFKKGNTLNIYAEANAEEALRRLICPPFWPVTLDEFPAEVRFHRLEKRSVINQIGIEVIAGVHPGGVSVMKLSASEKTVVFATDCTLTKEFRCKLREFAAGCDLLLIDGQYSDGEWAGVSTYGHSRWSSAAELGYTCRAKEVRIIHHDPDHTDELLHCAELELGKKYLNCKFGREDEVMVL